MEIESRQGLGYRLSQPLERLDAVALRNAAQRLGVNVLTVTDSTNAQLLASDVGHDPQVLFPAIQQHARCPPWPRRV